MNVFQRSRLNRSDLKTVFSHGPPEVYPPQVGGQVSALSLLVKSLSYVSMRLWFAIRKEDSIRRESRTAGILALALISTGFPHFEIAYS